MGQSDCGPIHMPLPVELVETDKSPVQMVLSVDVLRQLKGLSAQLETGIANSISHSSHNRSKVGIFRVEVLCQRVKAHDNILDISVFVRNLNCTDDGAVAEDLGVDKVLDNRPGFIPIGNYRTHLDHSLGRRIGPGVLGNLFIIISDWVLDLPKGTHGELNWVICHFKELLGNYCDLVGANEGHRMSAIIRNGSY